MTDQEKLKCCIAIIEFLEDEDNYHVFYQSPKLKIMVDVLTKYCGHKSMVMFTEFINDSLNMGYNIKDDNGLYKPFFSEKSISFYHEAIQKLRDKKIEEILIYNT